MSRRRKQNPRAGLVSAVVGILLVLLGLLAIRYGWFNPLGRAVVNWAYSIKPPAHSAPAPPN